MQTDNKSLCKEFSYEKYSCWINYYSPIYTQKRHVIVFSKFDKASRYS